jgi:hypothetical protein
MRMANVKLALDSYHDRALVDDYRWVDAGALETACAHAMANVPFAEGEFEHVLDHDGLTGRVDWCGAQRLVEMKLCAAHAVEHELQLVLYAAMHAVATGREALATLYNIRLGTTWTTEIGVDQGRRLLAEYMSLMD